MNFRYSTSSANPASSSCKMNATTPNRRVYCIVTDKYGNSVKTNVAELRMAATITTQPQSVTVAKGANAKVTLKAVGDGLTYKWYFKAPGADKFSLTTTFKGNSYSAEMSAARNGRQVYCVVTDKYGHSVKSNTVTLSMK